MVTDVWQAVTLGDVFPGVEKRAAELRAKTDKIISEANSVLEAFTTKARAAEGILTTTASVAEQISVSGFYMLPMLPGHGTIQSRINGADNAPPHGPDPLTCGMVIMFQGVDPVSVAERYQSLLKILTSPI